MKVANGVFAAASFGASIFCADQAVESLRDMNAFRTQAEWVDSRGLGDLADATHDQADEHRNRLIAMSALSALNFAMCGVQATISLRRDGE